jgi:subfamily B ATP-binding cassette protein MsbA
MCRGLARALRRQRLRLRQAVRGLVRRLARRLSEEERHTVRLLRDLLWRHRRAVAVTFFAGVLAAFFEGSTMTILTLALQTLMGGGDADLAASLGQLGSVVDDLRGGLGQDRLFLLLVGVAIVGQFLRSGLQFGGSAASAHIHASLEGEVRGRLFRQFTSMSHAQVNRYKIGDLVSYLEQASWVGKLASLLSSLISHVLIAVAYAVVLLWLSWPLTVAAVVALSLLSSSLRRIIGRIRKLARTFMMASVKFSERTVEYLQGLRLVRVFARQEYAADRVDDALSEGVAAKRQGLIWKATVTPVVESLTVLGVAVLLLAGYLSMGDLEQSVLPRMFTFVFIVYRLMPRVGTINDELARIVDTMPAVHRIAAMLRSDDKEYTTDGGRPFRSLRQAVEFRDVSMCYVAGEQPAVDRVSLVIPRGSMVALVGESGAGKSTVADLLLRLYDPTDGRILVDGVDLRELDLRTWRDRIGVVSQDTFIFNASIRENIAFGKLKAGEDEIVAAARAASAHDFIMETTHGYDTVVGDRGYRLSGGQRQRIAIARAILRDPDILVLDEATSDLDSQAEKQIQRALDRLREERTVLAIAHRLSTVCGADQILVLERGRLVESGTHAALLTRDGAYAAFWRLQGGGDSDG